MRDYFTYGGVSGLTYSKAVFLSHIRFYFSLRLIYWWPTILLSFENDSQLSVPNCFGPFTLWCFCKREWVLGWLWLLSEDPSILLMSWYSVMTLWAGEGTYSSRTSFSETVLWWVLLFVVNILFISSTPSETFLIFYLTKSLLCYYFRLLISDWGYFL